MNKKIGIVEAPRSFVNASDDELFPRGDSSLHLKPVKQEQKPGYKRNRFGVYIARPEFAIHR